MKEEEECEKRFIQERAEENRSARSPPPRKRRKASALLHDGHRERERGVRPLRPRRTRPRPVIPAPRLGPMIREKGRRSNGARRAEEEYCYQMKKRALLIAHTQGHAEAQMTVAINSK